MSPPEIYGPICSFLDFRLILDPCSNPLSDVPALIRWYEGALERAWGILGSVYMNPPFHSFALWFAKLLYEHLEYPHQHMIGLTMTRCIGNEWFEKCVMEQEHAIATPRRRTGFIDVNGKQQRSPDFGTLLVYYGPERERFVDHMRAEGWAATTQLRVEGI